MKVIFLTNVIRRMGMMQQTMEKLQQEGKLDNACACRWITDATAWDDKWHKELAGSKLVIMKWMGTGLDTPFLQRCVSLLKLGNEEDFTACLGFEVEGNDENLKSLNIEGYYKMLGEVVKVYPNFKVIATTLRTVKTATVNDWSAICYADGKVYNGLSLPNLEILDRVGGGDSFASGLIYGLMTTGDPQNVPFLQLT